VAFPVLHSKCNVLKACLLL